MIIPALYDDQRGAAFRWGVLLVMAACALMPLAGSTTVRPHVAKNAFGDLPIADEPSSNAASFPTLRRDPFVPTATDVPDGVRVEAVVFGPAPRALVQVGSQSMVVAVGDRLLGTRVDAIEQTGIRLGDGTWLGLGSR